MTKPIAPAPAARTWRDIPQPVKPRAMSRSGRRRLVTGVLRTTAGVAFCVALAWGAWSVAGALQENPGKMPAAAKAVPVRAPQFKTDGVLDHAWLERTLRIPKGASLMELDLEQLRARLLADGQVLTATLTRHFPDRLVVAVTERSPIAKVMAEWGGQQRPLLVARDGVMFAGDRHDPAMVERLPWLDGLTIARRGAAFLPLEGMEIVGELLAKARLEADHLYRSWRVVSLARLASDRELEVRTVQGVTIIFSAHGDFFRQLAKLDYMWEKIANVPDAQARIDLTLGREVPVRIEVAPAATAPDATPGGPAPTISLLHNSQPKTKREF
ncbi:MAG: FtsQ-type POTRA domain-containing protein [Verrucomicrobia bacterium]|nr:FtsQ-type POTRA domain-containing protein [Verrucomicrobiota bacterium]